MQRILHPLGSSSKRIVLGTPTGEGAPQGLRGWGVRGRGGWGRVPQWVWAKPKVYCHVKHGSAKPKSVADPYVF
ncbi:hypothetical protein EXW55_30100 (plasmid) [Bacillus mycoides]|nr:hypothetical protein EXW55_30100 [Bacillus mycoides]